MEDEAEESEDDERVAGLGDFGFTSSLNKPDEDEFVEAREDDFDDIVDELSDGEGDEEAAAKARIKRMMEDDKDEKAGVRGICM